MSTLQGHLLIAAPGLADSNFARCVVLVIQHDDDGAFGLVLNRRSSRTVRDVWSDAGEDPCDCEAPIFVEESVLEKSSKPGDSDSMEPDRLRRWLESVDPKELGQYEM